MDSRNDSSLYTGMTSASFAKQKKKRVERASANAETTAQLSLVDTLILAEIKKDREAIGAELGNLIHLEMSEQDIKVAVLGLRLADARMISLSNRLVNITRKRKGKEAIDVTEL